MTPTWYRLCVDLDVAGKAVGLSYEVRSSDRIVAIHVLPLPAPNAHPHDELEAMLQDLEQRYGLQLPLF